jgi:hypothetical protein
MKIKLSISWRLYVHTYVHVHVHMHICCIYTCIYAHTYVHMDICAHICLQVHIYIHTSNIVRSLKQKVSKFESSSHHFNHGSPQPIYTQCTYSEPWRSEAFELASLSSLRKYDREEKCYSFEGPLITIVGQFYQLGPHAECLRTFVWRTTPLRGNQGDQMSL